MEAQVISLDVHKTEARNKQAERIREDGTRALTYRARDYATSRARTSDPEKFNKLPGGKQDEVVNKGGSSLVTEALFLLGLEAVRCEHNKGAKRLSEEEECGMAADYVMELLATHCASKLNELKVADKDMHCTAGSVLNDLAKKLL